MTQPNKQKIINRGKSSLIKYCLSSIILIISACIISIIDPLERLLENQIELREGSLLFYIWKEPPLDVYLKVYIFNVTNGEEFLSGKDEKIKIVEVGPYVYQEYLVNQNPKFLENGTLQFVPHRNCVFVPEMSVGNPEEDFLLVPNIVLLAASSAATKISTFAAFGLSSIVKTLNAKAFINLTIHDFLWGYDDNLVKLANNLVPNLITFERLGILDRLFDEGHNVVSMILPEGVKRLNKEKLSNQEKYEDLPKIEEVRKSAVSSLKVTDVEYDDEHEHFNDFPIMDLKFEEKSSDHGSKKSKIRDYSIDMWNGSPGLKKWNYNESSHESNSACQILQGAYDGTVFPKNFNKNEKFFVYRKAFCRKLGIVHSHDEKVNGIEAYWFKLADNAFDDKIDDPESMCYCAAEKMCPKRGLGNITPCYYNLPVAVSAPHFYNADPSLLNDVDGLCPDEEKHGSYLAMQPRLGLPIKVASRIQLNLMNGATKFNSVVRKFDHLTLPILWIEASMKLTPFLNAILTSMFIILPVVQKTIIYVLAFIGCSGLALCVLKYFLYCNLPENHDKKSIKYSAVYPYIKREIAKFEEREREMIQRIDTV